MKNLPERIYIDLGFTPDADTDFNDLKAVTWSKDDATGKGIEYVRKDLFVGFSEWMEPVYGNKGVEKWFQKYLTYLKHLKEKEEGK